jgi:hypothetical protein
MISKSRLKTSGFRLQDALSPGAPGSKGRRRTQESRQKGMGGGEGKKAESSKLKAETRKLRTGS